MSRRIDDRKFFAGSGSPEFPKGVHTKHMKDGKTAGQIADYPDTQEAIESTQHENVRRLDRMKQKKDHRN